MNARINGKDCAFESGEYLIDVAKRGGFEIPTLCHHEGLRGQGSCRVCVVELDGRVVPACVTGLTNDCEVVTDSDRVMEIRKVVIALLQKRAPFRMACQNMRATDVTQHGWRNFARKRALIGRVQVLRAEKEGVFAVKFTGASGKGRVRGKNDDFPVIGHGG